MTIETVAIPAFIPVVYRGAVSPSARVRVVAVLAAVAAATVVVGVVWATGQDPPQPKARNCAPRQAYFVPGVTSAHVGAIRHAFTLSVRGTAEALEPLAQEATGDAVVQFNYALALYCAGYLADASQAFVAAKASGRDTFYEIRADSIMHPQYFDQGYPVFQPDGAAVAPLLRRGIAAQEAGHQHTAERLYARAARLHPDDDQAQVAAAVGRFDEDNLSASFSRLGPLVQRFPRSVSVRFHLGLLLAWTGQRAQAETEFRQAKRLAPRSPLGREANVFLQRLVSTRTIRTQR
jgi:tetratricopeptide (TPR) repeat protein